jgi:hypothetical protein
MCNEKNFALQEQSRPQPHGRHGVRRILAQAVPRDQGPTRDRSHILASQLMTKNLMCSDILPRLVRSLPNGSPQTILGLAADSLRWPALSNLHGYHNGPRASVAWYLHRRNIDFSLVFVLMSLTESEHERIARDVFLQPIRERTHKL